MKENTAMQKLIEFEKELVRTKGTEMIAFEIHIEVMAKAKELLEKERQQIVDAFEIGKEYWMQEQNKEEFDSYGNDYFTNKYNTND